MPTVSRLYGVYIGFRACLMPQCTSQGLEGAMFVAQVVCPSHMVPRTDGTARLQRRYFFLFSLGPLLAVVPRCQSAAG